MASSPTRLDPRPSSSASIRQTKRPSIAYSGRLRSPGLPVTPTTSGSFAARSTRTGGRRAKSRSSNAAHDRGYVGDNRPALTDRQPSGIRGTGIVLGLGKSARLIRRTTANRSARSATRGTWANVHKRISMCHRCAMTLTSVSRAPPEVGYIGWVWLGSARAEEKARGVSLERPGGFLRSSGIGCYVGDPDRVRYFCGTRSRLRLLSDREELPCRSRNL
jgi:hypothetical protein